MLRQGPFDASEFARRRRVVLTAEGRGLYIKSPEDSVLRKLLWFRAAESSPPPSGGDIVQVLRISGPKLDTSYLEEWARSLGVVELLARAREAAG